VSGEGRPIFSVPLPDGRTLELGARTLVMAIVNVTPDSFADGGVRFDAEVAVRDAIEMVAQGADLLDIGGESTRPGAEPLPADEEIARVVPVIDALRRRTDVPLSVDTYKAVVAERAIDAGAVIVNDVSGLEYDPGLADVVARRRAALVLMHNRGRSSDMYRLADYGDVATEVVHELEARLRRAEASGVERERVIVDPGLGFAKRPGHTFEAIAGLQELARLKRPILVGPSRKSYLKAALGDVPAGERLWGTAAAVTASALFGAHIVRAHDVAEIVQVVRVADAIRAAGERRGHKKLTEA
jgi:dihydropteroate synthase